MAHAIPREPVSSTRDAFRVGAGLQWNFGEKRPEFVLSGRWTQTRSNDSVSGGRLEIAIPVFADYRPTVRLLGLAGNRDAQGEVGFGYRFATSEFLIGVGVQGPYVNAGVNAFGGGLSPYFGFNSFGRAPAPSTGYVVPPPP